MTTPFSPPPELWVDLALDWEEIDRVGAILFSRVEPVIVLDPTGRTSWLDDFNVFGLSEHARYFRRRPPPPAPSLAVWEAEREEEDRPVDAEDTWVEFRFEYPDGSPVEGVNYLLIDPGRSESRASLGADGTIKKRGTRRGGYTVALEEIEAAFFRHKRRACDDDLEVIARTSGVPDGTPAKVKLYRELRESSADALAEVDAQVVGDRVEATLRYDYASGEALAAETGVIRLIAEVSIRDGKSWAKTEALELALKTLRSVTWSSPRVEAGEPLELVVETAGYPNGTSVSIEVWRLDWRGGDRKVCDVGPLTITGGRAVAAGAYRSAGADFTIDDCGEHYAIAKIDDNVHRVRRSDLVACAWVDTGEDASTEAA